MVKHIAESIAESVAEHIRDCRGVEDGRRMVIDLGRRSKIVAWV